MTLKQGSKVEYDTCKRFTGHDFKQVISDTKPLEQMIREILGLCNMMNPIQPQRCYMAGHFAFKTRPQ